MKILLIHAGPNPKPGSTNAYIDSVAQGLTELGHDVIQLHTAIRKNTLRGFHQKDEIKKLSKESKVTVVRWINSGVYAGPPPGSGSGSAFPVGNVIPSSKIREKFIELLNIHRPDIVHIQNLFGFPVALAEEIKKLNIPLILTLQDYTPICPTSHLFLPELKPCDLQRDELQCHLCCAGSKTYSQFATEEFFNLVLSRLSERSTSWMLLAGIRNRVSKMLQKIRRAGKTPAEYQFRFDGMKSLLHAADRIHCLSNLQALRICRAVEGINNIRVIPVSPPAVVHPKPVSPVNKRVGIRLCVLNVQKGRNDKGYAYLKKSLEALESRRNDFCVDWYAEGDNTACTKFHGGYSLDQLDEIAASTDFSITPSLWIETQAYTGVEMLARGVPLICSKRAGVSEWVEDGVTGILFNPSTTKELSDVIESLIEDSNKVKQIRDETMRRAYSIKTHKHHLREIEALYAEVV